MVAIGLLPAQFTSDSGRGVAADGGEGFAGAEDVEQLCAEMKKRLHRSARSRSASASACVERESRAVILDGRMSASGGVGRGCRGTFGRRRGGIASSNRHAGDDIGVWHEMDLSTDFFTIGQKKL